MISGMEAMRGPSPQQYIYSVLASSGCWHHTTQALTTEMEATRAPSTKQWLVAVNHRAPQHNA
jgi:hypothetical protein